MKTILRYSSLFILLMSFALPIKAQNRNNHRGNNYNSYSINTEKMELRKMKELSNRFDRAIVNRRFHRAYTLKNEIAFLMREDVISSRQQLKKVNQEIERLRRKSHHHNNGNHNHRYKNKKGHGPHNGYYSGRNRSNRMYVAMEKAKNLRWELKEQLRQKRQIIDNFQHEERNKRFSLSNDRDELRAFIREMRQDLNIGLSDKHCH